MTALDRFDQAAESDLLACCGSRAWACKMLEWRHDRNPSPPDPGAASVLAAASDIWFSLLEPDWLQAFACHPRIGESPARTTEFLIHSTSEQLATRQTLAPVEANLLELNHAYEARFGFLYIVFASGRTAPELLAVLEQRLHNTRAEELQEAARQQDRITRLRLERWLAK